MQRVEVAEKSRKEINELLEAHNFKKQAEHIEKEPQYEEEDEDISPEQEMGEMPDGDEMEGMEDSVDADGDHEQAPGEERVVPTEKPHEPSDEL